MKEKFEQFIRERKYLSNVTPATVEWYTQSLQWLETESPTESDLKNFVFRMRERGLKATGCNNRIRAVNAYLKWSGSTLRVPKLKEPQFILPTFTLPQVSLLTGSKPKRFYGRRMHLLTLILLDTGCRISEALGIRGRGLRSGQSTRDPERQGSEATQGSLQLRTSQTTVPLLTRVLPTASHAAVGNATGMQVGPSCHGAGCEAPLQEARF